MCKKNPIDYAITKILRKHKAALFHDSELIKLIVVKFIKMSFILNNISYSYYKNTELQTKCHLIISLS